MSSAGGWIAVVEVDDDADGVSCCEVIALVDLRRRLSQALNLFAMMGLNLSFAPLDSAKERWPGLIVPPSLCSLWPMFCRTG